jgi:DnaA family protein
MGKKSHCRNCKSPEIVDMRFSHPQIPFCFGLQEAFSFNNFSVGSNQAVVQQLQRQLSCEGDPLLYLWGVDGAGCSHLLQAGCHLATQQGFTAMYLPMTEIRTLDPVILQGIEDIDLICIDDLQTIAGLHEWEEALFHLFNRVQQQTTRLLIGARKPPRGVGLELPDLVSRFSSCAVFQVNPLEEGDKLILLQERALQKGIELSQEAAQYVLNRSKRNTGVLLQILDRLDQSSMAASRKLTIPFIKQSLNW